MDKRFVNLLIGLLVSITLIACTSSQAEVVATGTDKASPATTIPVALTSTETPQPTLTYTAIPSPSPTNTAAPTSTSTPTSSPTLITETPQPSGEELGEVIKFCEARTDWLNNAWIWFLDITEDLPDEVDQAILEKDSETGKEIADLMGELALGVSGHFGEFPRPSQVTQIILSMTSAWETQAESFEALARYFETWDESFYDLFVSLYAEYADTWNDASDAWHEIAESYGIDPFDCN